MSEEWVIAIVGGMTLVGKLTECTIVGNPSRRVVDRLSPVYQLHAQTMSGPGGQIGCAHMVTPLAWLSGWTSIDLPPHTPMVALDKLSPKERETIERGVKQAEDFRMQMRAAQAGIAIAPAGAKLPPLVVK